MQFFDHVKIKIKAGDGGNGAIAFHREKYISHGVQAFLRQNNLLFHSLSNFQQST